nr:aldo/keto reductase [uncultured Enterobacter sp.]
MKIRKLGKNGPDVSALGLGCMGMSFAYGSSDEQQSAKLLHQAVETGINFFDTAELYGPYTNEALLGRTLKHVRQNVIIATKFGFNISDKGEGMARISGVTSHPDHIRRAVEGSLRRLGTDVIDLLYQHRVDPAIPVEEVVGVMADLVHEGKVRWLGLSEASASTLRRAHRVHPITALQSEYSLWSRDVENDVLATCRELGVGFVPYSPLGRGFLTGKLKDPHQLSEDDFRRSLPRFQAPAMQKNRMLLKVLEEVADEQAATPAQTALAWLLAQGEEIVPVPGMRKHHHLIENVKAVELTLNDSQRDRLSQAFSEVAVTGKRYTDAELQMVNL